MPAHAIRAEIRELFGSDRDIAEVLEEAMRLSARLVLQQVLEDEVTTWLGRDWNSRSDGERAGQRNGYGDLTIKTTAGPLELKRPKLRNTTERFASTLLGKGWCGPSPWKLFLDGSHFKMHDGSRAEPVLVAYGITTVGQPVLAGRGTGRG